MAIYLSQHFNFEFVNKKYEKMLPTATFGMNRVNKIEVILTKNE